MAYYECIISNKCDTTLNNFSITKLVVLDATRLKMLETKMQDRIKLNFPSHLKQRKFLKKTQNSENKSKLALHRAASFLISMIRNIENFVHWLLRFLPLQIVMNITALCVSVKSKTQINANANT